MPRRQKKPRRLAGRRVPGKQKRILDGRENVLPAAPEVSNQQLESAPPEETSPDDEPDQDDPMDFTKDLGAIEATPAPSEEIFIPVIEEVLPLIEESLPVGHEEKKKRVFVMHGKSRMFEHPVEKLLEFGEMMPVVSESGDSSKAVRKMKTCGAAIMHVDAGEESLSQDELVHLGAAMAVFGKRFVLLAKENLSLPASLQDVKQVRYSGDALDSETTLRIVDAIRHMKGGLLED